jgi:hypothetical protein
MSETGYGSGPAYDPQAGYGQQPYGQAYGQQAQGSAPARPGPYGYAQRDPGQQPDPAGHRTGGYPSTQVPAAPAPPDRLGQIATVLTVVGYVCAGAGLLSFILWLAADGDGTYRFATALQSLVLGIGFGGLNLALGTWLGQREPGR